LFRTLSPQPTSLFVAIAYGAPQEKLNASPMKIDVHSHQIEEIFFDALRALPGVTVKTNPDRFS
jgi:hypothetical protein